MPVGHRHILSGAGDNCNQRAGRALARQNKWLNTIASEEVLATINAKSSELFLRPMARQAVLLKNWINFMLEDNIPLIVTALNRWHSGLTVNEAVWRMRAPHRPDHFSDTVLRGPCEQYKSHYDQANR